MCACMYTNMCVFDAFMYNHMNVCMHACIIVYTCMHACMFACVHVRKHLHMLIDKCIHIGKHQDIYCNMVHLSHKCSAC